jgi:hypothetical protein
MRPSQTYTWVLDPHGLICYHSPDSFQTITKLWETTERTGFHDAELAQATKEINGILSALEKRNRDSERKLSFIQFQNQHFLVWARYGAVGPHDDPTTLIKALKLKN